MQFEGTPYWQTLEPIIQSGAMESAIKGEYRYPYRINLYPGVSCMFKCVFCGRNHDAIANKSKNIFSEIIEQDDGSDPHRINVTGGLEPLTSPYINQICKDLHNKGYRSRMITNAFMLTDKMLVKNPYINSLHHIRVSLYGLDKNESVLTTRHKGSWSVVRDNLKKYNLSSDKTDLYLNYVLLPRHFENLDRILEYVDHIGGVKNLSLREDFSFQYTINDRAKVQDLLLTFDEKIKKRDLKVDYGYALTDAMNGIMTPLLRVKHDEITVTQSPQIKICINPHGDIFSHMQAGFVGRKGSQRHSLGNVTDSSIEEQLKQMKHVRPEPNDLQYVDTFNNLVYKYIHEQRKQNVL